VVPGGARLPGLREPYGLGFGVRDGPGDGLGELPALGDGLGEGPELGEGLTDGAIAGLGLGVAWFVGFGVGFGVEVAGREVAGALDEPGFVAKPVAPAGLGLGPREPFGDGLRPKAWLPAEAPDGEPDPTTSGAPRSGVPVAPATPPWRPARVGRLIPTRATSSAPSNSSAESRHRRRRASSLELGG